MVRIELRLKPQPMPINRKKNEREKKHCYRCCGKGIVCGLALVNIVPSQSEDNRHAIIQFVTSEMRKSQASAEMFFSCMCVDVIFRYRLHVNVNEIEIT